MRGGSTPANRNRAASVLHDAVQGATGGPVAPRRAALAHDLLSEHAIGADLEVESCFQRRCRAMHGEDRVTWPKIGEAGWALVAHRDLAAVAGHGPAEFDDQGGCCWPTPPAFSIMKHQDES